MRWLIFVILAYVALALQLGLANLWGFGYAGGGSVTPSLVLIVAVSLGVWAPPRTTAWVFLLVGLCLDALSVYEMNVYPSSGNVLGPMALGYLVGAYLVVKVRGIFYRESPLALAVIVLGAGVVIHLVAVTLLSLRGSYAFLGEPIPRWSVADQLVRRFLEVIYTALLTVPVTAIIVRLYPGWGYDTGKTGHHSRR